MDSGLLNYQTVDIEITESKPQDLYPYIIGRLDAFFIAIYTYYAEHGFKPATTKLIVGRLKAALVCFSFGLLTQGLNWRTGELRLSPEMNLLTVIFLLMCGYWLILLRRSWHQYRTMVKLRRLYYEGLDLPDANLPYTEWPLILQSLHKLRQEGHLPCLVKPLTTLDITNHILRRENFILALIQTGVIPATHLTPFSLNAYELGLIAPLYTSEAKFDRDFLGQPRRLRRRLMCLSFGSFILAPCWLIITCVKFFLTYAQDIYQRRAGLVGRQLTLAARWQIREYNELEHTLNARLEPVEESLRGLADMHGNYTVSWWAQFGVALFGSITALLLLLTVLNPAGFGSLVWALAAASSLSLLCREFIITSLPTKTAEFYLNHIVQATHLVTGIWSEYQPYFITQKAVPPKLILKLQQEIGTMYTYKILILWDELVTLILLPYLLWSLANRAEEIMTHLTRLAETTSGGDFCRPAQFKVVTEPKVVASQMAFNQMHASCLEVNQGLDPRESDSSDEAEESEDILKRSFDKIFGSVINPVESKSEIPSITL